MFNWGASRVNLRSLKPEVREARRRGPHWTPGLYPNFSDSAEHFVLKANRHDFFKKEEKPLNL